MHLQYRSKVSWQSLEPRSLSLQTRYSILDNFEYQVSSLGSRVSRIESRVKKVNELVAWLISREINCTNGLQTKWVYADYQSCEQSFLLTLKQIITTLRVTDSIVNTDKGMRVFSCDQMLTNEWISHENKICWRVLSIENTFAYIAAWKKEQSKYTVRDHEVNKFYTCTNLVKDPGKPFTD